jgi:8-oxo-dGTP diphosphatase
MDNMKTVKAIGGIIINDKNEILCTQRDKSKYPYASYKWEFPGGKVEEGETNEQTLKRELIEELEINVDVERLFESVDHTYPDFKLDMPVYLCKITSGKIKLNVHLDYKWLKPKEILSLDWVAADIPVAKKIVKMGKKFNR